MRDRVTAIVEIATSGASQLRILGTLGAVGFAALSFGMLVSRRRIREADLRTRRTIVLTAILVAIAIGIVGLQAARWASTFDAIAHASPDARAVLLDVANAYTRPLAIASMVLVVLALGGVVVARSDRFTLAAMFALGASLAVCVPLAASNARVRLGAAAEVHWPSGFEPIIVDYVPGLFEDFGNPTFVPSGTGCNAKALTYGEPADGEYAAFAIDRNVLVSALPCISYVHTGAVGDDHVVSHWIVRARLPSGETIEAGIPMRTRVTERSGNVHLHVTKIGWVLRDRDRFVESDPKEMGIPTEVPFSEDLRTAGSNAPPVLVTAEADVTAERLFTVIAKARLRVRLYMGVMDESSRPTRP